MKYLRKANISNDPNIKDKYQKLVDHCDKLIEFYKKQFAPDDIDMDETEPIGEEQLLESTIDGEEDTLSGDISGRRIKSLVSIMRSILFSRKVTYTSHDLKTKMSSITDAEATLCTSWLNSIVPYIPGKTQMIIIAYQLPLVILTSNILTATGYGGKRCEICPLPSVTSLSAYTLDTIMIFNMFCSNSDEEIEIYDYKGEATASENEALSCKDAIFDAFFDISKISKLCDSHDLNFIHHFHILPSAKTVRIIGALKKPSAYQRVIIIGGPKAKD
ncbi:hypothetical protein K501DRAFT_316547 [Backusella circina FSU 941]|nr:hypothetical protein K501DRAFT_316547 [Backusella circina FSU 941]